MYVIFILANSAHTCQRVACLPLVHPFASPHHGQTLLLLLLLLLLLMNFLALLSHLCHLHVQNTRSVSQ